MIYTKHILLKEKSSEAAHNGDPPCANLHSSFKSKLTTVIPSSVGISSSAQCGSAALSVLTNHALGARFTSTIQNETKQPNQVEQLNLGEQQQQLSPFSSNTGLVLID